MELLLVPEVSNEDLIAETLAVLSVSHFIRKENNLFVCVESVTTVCVRHMS